MSDVHLAVIFASGFWVLVAFVSTRVIRSSYTLKAHGDIPNFFSGTIELGPASKAEISAAADEAAKKTPQPDTSDGIDELLHAHLDRVPRQILWLDDHPENNVWEIQMLRATGASIVAVTRLDAALDLIDSGATWDLFITDLTQSDDPLAGIAAVEVAKSRLPDVPAIVYSMNAGDRASRAQEAGAIATVETAIDLLAIVLANGLSDRARRR